MKSIGSVLKKILTAALCASTLLLAAIPVSAASSADPFVNLFDKSTAFAGTVNKSGVETPNSQYYTSAYIEVKEGDVVRFGPANPNQPYHLHGYGSKTTISQPMVKADSLSVAQSFAGNPDGNATPYVIYAYTVPKGVTGVRIVCETALSSAFTVTKNQLFTTAKYFDYWRNPARAEAFRAGGGYAGDVENSPLTGRSVLFMGDSITHANRETSPIYQGWAMRIGEAYDMTYANVGRNGATVAEYSGLSQIEDQINNNKYDFVMMHGGINDYSKNITLGTLTAADDFDGPYNTSTFAGGLENLFMKVKNKYPTAKLGYIINFALTSNAANLEKYGITAATVGNFPQYVGMIKAACAKWGISYVDLSTDEIKTKLKVDTTELLPDYLHLNAKGYDIVTPYIAAFMESLAPEWIPNDEPPATPNEPSQGDTPNADEPSQDVTPDAEPPAADESETTEETEETKLSVTTADADTTASDDTASGGCGASLSLSAALTAGAAVAASYILTKKKKED